LHSVDGNSPTELAHFLAITPSDLLLEPVR
jgi:hypothetical protein